jgi:hypothetical protein
MDAGTDKGTDTEERWLTYGELAALRGIDRHSAVKLVTRHRWRRQKDNRGVLRILVPAEWTASRDKGTDIATDRGTDTAAFETALAAIEAAHASEVTALRERLDAADKDRIAMHVLADRLGAQLADTASRGDRANDRADRLDRERAAARAAAAALRQADAARKARGRWARLRAAWSGG